jgi:hypothetical protein
VDYDVHPKRLRKVLRAAGILDTESEQLEDSHAVFPLEPANSIVLKSKDALSVRQLETYLGAGRVQAALIVKHGFIKPFVQFPSNGHRPPSSAIAREDADAFLAKLCATAANVSEMPAGSATMPTAAKIANRGVAEIIRLVLDAKLEWVGKLLSTTGYLSVLVNVEEIKTHLHLDALPGLTIRKIAQRLGIADRAATKLCSSSILPTTVVRHPIHKCPVTVVSEAAMSKFEEEFVPLFKLAQERNIHFRALKKLLGDAGIYPALTSEQAGASFYRRALMPD